MSFSWIIGIGSATRITPATQQAAPTTWPRRVEGTMSPYLENIPREKMENIKRSNEWEGDLIRQPVTSVGHRINLLFLTAFEPPRHYVGPRSTKLWRLLHRPAPTRLQWRKKPGNEVVLGAMCIWHLFCILLGSAILIAYSMVMNTEKCNDHRLPWLNETRKLFYRNSPRFPCMSTLRVYTNARALIRQKKFIGKKGGGESRCYTPLSLYNFSPGYLSRAVLLPLSML